MPIYKFDKESFSDIDKTTFKDEKILERKHLQNALKKKINIIAPDCMVFAEEFSEWSGSQRRIDLLAIDKAANIVVIELKRNDTGEQMELQAIRYASMVSTLTYKRAIEIYQNYIQKNRLNLNAEEKILEFLEWDEPQEEDFAEDIRIILVSSDFSKELTTAVMWLNNRNLDIKCIRLIPYKYKDDILVEVQQIIPLPEAENYQVKFRQKTEEQRQARKSNRDYTKYQYKNTEYNKRKLVLAIIMDWIADNNPKDFKVLEKAFPQNTRKSGLYLPYEKAKEVYDRQQIPRHFLEENEIVKFPDGTKYAISNQWGKGNIERFINRAREIGIEILEL